MPKMPAPTPQTEMEGLQILGRDGPNDANFSHATRRQA